MRTNEYIATFLSTNGFGELGINVFCENMPIEPVNQICVYNYENGKPTQIYNKSYFESEGLQIRIRNTDKHILDTISTQIKTLVDNIDGFNIEDNIEFEVVYNIQRVSNIINISREVTVSPNYYETVINYKLLLM